MFNSLPLILILLISSVFTVAIFRKLRLPVMLAYFLVGVALGPHTFGLLPDSEANREFAEFGIVFLMFSIGLEFSLPQLYAMRKKVLGVGGGQVLATLGISMLVGKIAELPWTTTFVIGAALTMSSTAIVSKILAERIDLNSRHGRLSIGVLLFQDIAVVPILVMIPALSAADSHLATVLGVAMLKAIAMLLLLFTVGKWLINPWFNIVAGQRSRELFVMNVLMVTLLLAFATSTAGLSYALGAFIAGMLISETKYRYQVESDISPFRDIMLGVFFISVGMLLNLQQIISNIGLILLTLAAFVVAKALIVAAIVKFSRYEAGVAVRTAIILAQAGEFSFVILALGAEHQLIAGQTLQVVLAASLLSMVIAPFLINHNGKIARKLVNSYNRNSDKIVESVEKVGRHMENHVVICGFGRSGQYLARFLREENIPYIALDIDPARVLEAAAAGENVMFGDAARRVVLAAAGCERAKALIISYADDRAAMKILHIAQEAYPQLPVIVRTVDDSNMEKLREAGAAEVVPEILEGSLMVASHALMLLGVPLNRVVKRIRLFREERYKLFKGYFHGISDAESEDLNKQQERLHSVIITNGAYAIGRSLSSMQLGAFDVEVKSIRRPNSNGAKLNENSQLAEGDVVVLLGQSTGLTNAESALLVGRLAIK